MEHETGMTEEEKIGMDILSSNASYTIGVKSHPSASIKRAAEHDSTRDLVLPSNDSGNPRTCGRIAGWAYYSSWIVLSCALALSSGLLNEARGAFGLKSGDQREDEITEKLLGLTRAGVLVDELAPQHRAREWILNLDTHEKELDLILMQRYVLATLYFSTRGDRWHRCSRMDDYGCNEVSSLFLSGKGECEWHGIECANGIVTRIDLSGNNLRGAIPPEVEYLEGLQDLLLFNNSLTGVLPTPPSAIKSIILHDNKLAGTIPDLNQLLHLHTFQANNNYLKGSLPTNLPHSLHTFRVNSNRLIGSIPPSLFLNLINLDLKFNLLTGTFPKFNAPRLQSLNLEANSLTGTLPYFAPPLQFLFLSSNRFSGTMPDADSLKLLDLSNNRLVGSLPPLKANLETVWLQGNRLTGTLPWEMGLASSLGESPPPFVPHFLNICQSP